MFGRQRKRLDELEARLTQAVTEVAKTADEASLRSKRAAADLGGVKGDIRSIVAQIGRLENEALRVSLDEVHVAQSRLAESNAALSTRLDRVIESLERALGSRLEVQA